MSFRELYETSLVFRQGIKTKWMITGLLFVEIFSDVVLHKNRVVLHKNRVVHLDCLCIKTVNVNQKVRKFVYNINFYCRCTI